MKEKVKKSQVLNQLANTPRKGLYKLKDNQVTDEFNVLVISESDGKIYEADKSAFGGGSSSSGLFPNGFEIVEMSRDFLITDKGKILLLAEGVTVTLPESPTIFTTGDVVGIYADSSTSSYNRGNGADTFLYHENDKSELVVLTYADGDFTEVSSFPVDDNGVRKTALKYLYDNLGFRGTATLASGTVTVSDANVKTGDIVFVTVNTPSGTVGFLSASTANIVDATEFVINSSSALDNSTVNWWIKTP